MRLQKKEFWGLKIINIRDFNSDLLLKWWWKLLPNLSSKCALLASQNYRPSPRWWMDHCKNVASSSTFWKGLHTVKEIFVFGVST